MEKYVHIAYQSEAALKESYIQEFLRIILT